MGKVYQGIITKVVPYKETDAIITLLTKDEGYISFKARGVFKINSKNSSSLQLYTIGEYTLESKLDYSNKTLSSSNIIFFPMCVYDDLKYSCFLSFLNDVCNIYKDNYLDAYNLLETFIKNLDKINILTSALLILKYILKWNGVLFEVNECVRCSNKKVVSFSYEEGGFLCHKCSHSNLEISNLLYMKQMRIIIKANIENLFSFTVDEIIGYKLILDLFKYIENNLGVNIKSKEMFLMSINNTDSRLTR